MRRTGLEEGEVVATMKIGIAVDGSSRAIAGVELVAGLPLSGRDEVAVVCVAEPGKLLTAAPFGHVPSVARIARDFAEMARYRADQVVEHAAERLIGSPCRVTPIVREGHPVEVLEWFAREHPLDLLVIGPRGHGGVGSILLGSVSQALLHAMPTSVLVARPPVSSARRVLLGVDGSEPSMEAARFLASFPLPADAVISVLVSVTPWTDEYSSIRAADYISLLAAERAHAEDIAERAIGILAEHGRKAQPIVREGDPKREILFAAQELDVDLIVTGARGVGGFKGLVLGSVSRAISKAAPCSTLVVAGPPAPLPRRS
jgi:nucleotide-binding universal stress UspA family protein